MQKRNALLTIFGLMLILLSSCTQQTNTPEHTSQAVIPLKPAGAIPATCTPTPVYFGSQDGNPATPWVVATPLASGITGYLFFSQVEPAKKPVYYLPMHADGKMPGGATTKVLWKIQNTSALGEIILIGKNLSLPHSIMQQTFVASSDGVPSIINVPTAGCWHFDLQSGSDHATVTFWVLP